MTPADPRTGILIVRMWWEDQAPEGLRAHVTHTLDSAEPEQQTASAGGADGLYEVVRCWVEEFVATVPSPSPETPGNAGVTRRVDAVSVTFLLVLAVVLFLLGAFTIKLLWWVAVVLAGVWLVDKLRSGSNRSLR